MTQASPGLQQGRAAGSIDPRPDAAQAPGDAALHLRQLDACLDAMPGGIFHLHVHPLSGLSLQLARGQLARSLDLDAPTGAERAQRLLAAFAEQSRGRLAQRLSRIDDAEPEVFSLILELLQTRQGRRVEWSGRLASTPHADGSRSWHCQVTHLDERERWHDDLLRRAETDALTRLPNREALMAQLQARLAESRPFALMFMDCDRFKAINDSLGHEAGDELLRHLAQRLRRDLRDRDLLLAGALEGRGPSALAARLGGDEFVVVADGIAGAPLAESMARRLSASLARPYVIQGRQIVSSVSIGIVLAGEDSTPSQLLRDADIAMYEAKRLGPGRCVSFEPVMHQRVAGALDLESDLRRALAADELRVVYQPIVEMASGRIVGLEALARWRDPVRGEVPPGEFIPLAEATGLIVEVGRAVLQRACAEFASWRAMGLPTPDRLSVNLSRAQLLDPALAESVGEILARHGLGPASLQLEITESLAMDDQAAGFALLGLKALGVRLSLDDFGTGHSSLASLQRLPVQQVKIDRSFVRELQSSAYHQALVRAAFHVAAALQLEVVAEGVERVEQARELMGMGCSRAQGWLFAPGLEADAVPEVLRRGMKAVVGGADPSLGMLTSVSRAHAVVVTDAAGLVEYVNDAFVQLTGYTAADLHGRKPGSVLQGPDSDMVAVATMREAIRSGQACTGVEIVNYRKDGRAYRVQLDIEPVRDGQGRVQRFVSVQTDITDQRRRDAELRLLRQAMGEVRAVGLVGLWERDLTTGKGRSDAQALRMLGLDPNGPSPGLDEIEALLTPDSMPAFERYRQALADGERSGPMEYAVRHPDGSVHDLVVHWSRIADMVVGVTVDVTGSRQAQARRDELMKMVEMAAEAGGLSLWVHDQQDDSLTWVPRHRPGGRHSIGPRAGTGAEALTLVLPEDRPIMLKARRDAVERDEVVEAEYRMVDAAGVRDVFTRRTGQRDADGRTHRVIGVSIDVTTLRRRESELAELSTQLGQVLEIARMGMFRFDVQARRFDFDRHFAAIYGFAADRSAIDWEDWLQHVHPDDRGDLLRELSHVRDGGVPVPHRLTFRIVDSHGGVRHIESHRASVNGPDGRALAVVGAHRDITELVLV